MKYKTEITLFSNVKNNPKLDLNNKIKLSLPYLMDGLDYVNQYFENSDIKDELSYKNITIQQAINEWDKNLGLVNEGLKTKELNTIQSYLVELYQASQFICLNLNDIYISSEQLAHQDNEPAIRFQIALRYLYWLSRS